MSKFVLVHGAWHGAWCWYKVVPLLERAGHEVIAMDLPSLGIDRTPISAVTLETWTDSVVAALDRGAEQSVLVGHSMGGIVISQAAERHPEKVKILVYISAFLLRDGESLLSLAAQDPGKIPEISTLSSDGRSMNFNPHRARDVLYNDCSEDDIALATRLLPAQALAPLESPQRLSESRFGRVPRIYIQCLRDRAVPPALQFAMCASSPCARIIAMDSDHSPFLSHPQALAGHLLDLGAG
jgi:pimeloyl-ACP methyl ester carboxylesterase